MTRMPCACASAGERNVCGTPPTSRLPWSGWCTPSRMRTSVDFPAPFSPDEREDLAGSRRSTSVERRRAPERRRSVSTRRAQPTGAASIARKAARPSAGIAARPSPRRTVESLICGTACPCSARNLSGDDEVGRHVGRSRATACRSYRIAPAS